MGQFFVLFLFHSLTISPCAVCKFYGPKSEGKKKINSVSFRPSGNICLTLLSAWDGKNMKLQYCMQTSCAILIYQCDCIHTYRQTNIMDKKAHTMNKIKYKNGEVRLVIFFLVMWWWVDGGGNSTFMYVCKDSTTESARGRDTHKDNTFLSLFYDNKNWVLLFFLMCTFYILLFTSSSSSTCFPHNSSYILFLRVNYNYKWLDTKLVMSPQHNQQYQ